MSGLGKYHISGYGLIGVYRVKILRAWPSPDRLYLMYIYIYTCSHFSLTRACDWLIQSQVPHTHQC